MNVNRKLETMVGRNALVIDADPTVRTVIRYILESSGCSVIAAASVDEALERCCARSPEMVLVDLLMPGIEPWGALERIRQSFPGIPILTLPSLPGPPPPMYTRSLAKPFTAGQLMENVHQMLT